MKKFAFSLMVVAGAALSANAGVTVSGVGAITEGLNNNNAGTGGTLLVNTGTILDGLYGTENLGYLVDDYPGILGWSDNLTITATVEVNDQGTVSGADNSMILGYFSDPNHTGDYSPAEGASGNRSQAMFAVNLLGPNDGRIFLNIGGNLVGPVGSWASSFGRNNPFQVDLAASEAGGLLTVTGTISQGATVINVNESSGVNAAQGIEAFGTSSGFGPQTGTLRNFGADVSNLSYVSTVPEPASLALMGLGAAAMFRRRR